MTSRGQPRPCVSCGTRPKAGPRVDHCFECLPGGPVTPPPCRRCGSSGDYYSGGLCRRCHPRAPQQVDSCCDCHAWGATRHTGWLCAACRTWQGMYFANHNQLCKGCARTIAVNSSGICRLCRAQLRRLRRDHGIRFDDPALARSFGAQLFFAGMRRAAATWTRPPPERRRVPWPPGRPVPWRQLVMFTVLPDLRGTRSSVGPPRDPILYAALEQVLADHARELGWRGDRTKQVRAGIRILLGLQDTPGAPIKTSEQKVLVQISGMTQSLVRDVLDKVGILEDDSTPSIEGWFEHKVEGLPEQMRKELRIWFDIMRHGSTTPPRRRPRTSSTINTYLNYALPALQAWALAGHDSLREITTEDVAATLPASGPARSWMARSLKAIFVVLKSRKIVFTNPLARTRSWHLDRPLPLPSDLGPTRDALNSPAPARAAIAALAAFCGLTTNQLRCLQLTDIRDGKLHLDGRAIPLAEPVRNRIAAWLDYRNQRWPTTTNPHLFVNNQTAFRTTPVGLPWTHRTLDIPGGVRAVRRDRILDEAIATRGDARRLCDLFGIQHPSRHPLHPSHRAPRPRKVHHEARPLSQPRAELRSPRAGLRTRPN